MFITILLVLGGLSFFTAVIVLSALMLSSRFEHGFEMKDEMKSAKSSYAVDTVPVSRRVDTRPV